MKITEVNGKLTFCLEGQISAANAEAFEKELTQAVASHPGLEPLLDAGGLEYISSAGLRVLLRLQKQSEDKLTVCNVSPEVYDIFSVTGFTKMMNVEKALRFVSVNGLEQIGSGAHSAVYRLDGETILKVVKDMTLEAIRSEMEVSKDVLIYGIPTAISYDVVRTEEGYGEVYEMFHAGVLSAAVMAEPERREEFLRRFADMYREIHSVRIEDDVLFSAKERYLAAADRLATLASPREHALMRALIESIPDSRGFVHGDFHMNNVMFQGDELLLIYVGEAGYGHPLFDFAQTMAAYTGMTTVLAHNVRKVLGLSLEEAVYVRDNLFPMYFGDTGEALERKMEVIHGVATMRMLLSPFLQGVSGGEDIVRSRLERVGAEFFPTVERLCQLIKSEF